MRTKDPTPESPTALSTIRYFALSGREPAELQDQIDHHDDYARLEGEDRQAMPDQKTAFQPTSDQIEMFRKVTGRPEDQEIHPEEVEMAVAMGWA